MMEHWLVHGMMKRARVLRRGILQTTLQVMLGELSSISIKKMIVWRYIAGIVHATLRRSQVEVCEGVDQMTVL